MTLISTPVILVMIFNMMSELNIKTGKKDFLVTNVVDKTTFDEIAITCDLLGLSVFIKLNIPSVYILVF